MFNWLKDSLEKRHARFFLDGVHAWYRACSRVIEIMGVALQDESAVNQDIGIILDKADRLLFGLRDTTADACRALRKYDPSLALRLQRTSNQVYALRNEVTRFLIRAQGPGFPSVGQVKSVNRDQYYTQAMADIGFRARQMIVELDREMASLWAELQGLLTQADKLLQRG